MGQKGNLQSIRPFFKNLNLFNLSKIQFLESLSFVKALKYFFNKKLIVPVDITFNLVGSKGVLAVVLFSRTVKIGRFNKRLGFSRPFAEYNSSFLNFVVNNLKGRGVNLVALKLTLINKAFSKLKKSRFLQVLYLTHRSFRDSVFVRRDGLFFDFLKIVFLFSRGLVNSRVFLFFLSETFKFLPKYKHVRFISLLKKTFNVLVDPAFSKTGGCSSIGGIKFSVAGKFKGKLRKSRVSVQVGKVPAQSISKDVEFSKIHVFTRYGVFGFKLLVYRK